jgi:hypothetical protein
MGSQQFRRQISVDGFHVHTVETGPDGQLGGSNKIILE